MNEVEASDLMIATPYPSRRALWAGCIAGGIVNAMRTAKSETYAPFRQWVRNHYILNGCDGRKGVVTFAGGHWFDEGPLIGVFTALRANSTAPAPGDDEWLDYHFRNGPQYQRDLAYQTAMTYLELDPIDSDSAPPHLGVFWNDVGVLTGADSWETIRDRGAGLIDIEVVADQHSADLGWRDDYALSDEEVVFARSLIDRKLARPPVWIRLGADETRWLRSQAADPKAWQSSVEMFAEIGISVPQ